MLSSGVDVVRFMTVDFVAGFHAEWPARLLARGKSGTYGFVVTPNVDHLVNMLENKIDTSAYRAADLVINDSRILQGLARLAGKNLPAIPGSDIVASILDLPEARHARIVIVGPVEEDFERLQQRYPDLDLDLVPSSRNLVRNSPEWTDLIETLAASPFDLLLVCISFPKQEYLAHDLGRRGCERGLALCVGSSIDYLTGRQTRAPGLLQSLRLEWAYRLVSNPRRLWRRYLLRGPRIFYHLFRLELVGQGKSDP